MNCAEKITATGLWPSNPKFERDDLAVPPEVEVDLCATWLRRFATPSLAFVRYRSSYAIKHLVEDWTRTHGRLFEQVDPQGRAWGANYHYISNGSLIEAARRAGYHIARDSAESPYAVFNMRISRAALAGRMDLAHETRERAPNAWEAWTNEDLATEVAPWPLPVDPPR